MTFSFDPAARLILVRARIDGPAGTAALRLGLDTGASRTVINTAMLLALGYDPGVLPDRIQITTGSGIEFVPRVLLQRFVALGQQRDAFEVLGHTLPASAKIDGLLGLDFMRGQTLTVDFRLGQVRLE